MATQCHMCKQPFPEPRKSARCSDCSAAYRKSLAARTDRTCSECGDGLPAGRVQAYCRPCMAKRMVDYRRREGRTCTVCKAPIPSGRKSTICKGCHASYIEEYRMREGRTCSRCAADIPVGRKSSLCSGCQWLYDARPGKKCADCNTELLPGHSNSYCVECGKARLRAYRLKHPNKFVGYWQKRTALKQGAFVGQVDMSLVILSGGGCCPLCKVAIETGKGHVDHIVPLSRGGSHSQDNLQYLCANCNRRKHNKLETELTWLER